MYGGFYAKPHFQKEAKEKWKWPAKKTDNKTVKPGRTIEPSLACLNSQN